MKRKYYSQRRGTNPHSRGIEFNDMKSLVLAVYDRLHAQDYFQEHFGYYCVDAGSVAGTLGSDIESAILFKLRKRYIWPFRDNWMNWDEDDAFDVIEFLFDHISKPVEGYCHSYGNCGMHYSKFDRASGQKEFREAVNEILEDYGEGFELSAAGEVLRLADPGTGPLLEAPVPTKDASVRARVEAAIRKYRRHNSTADDRRDAVRDLADVLEKLRPSLKAVLTRKDESDLFQIANQFGLRHFNDSQKTDYDGPIWLSWMFYFYLSTIHASLRLLEKQSAKTSA